MTEACQEATAATGTERMQATETTASSVTAVATTSTPSGGFDLRDEAGYRIWRERKLASARAGADPVVVDLRDPRRLTRLERARLLDGIARENYCVYRAAVADEDPGLPVALAAQLGLRQLDANWLAEDDGVSRIAVSDRRDERGGFVPYTDRAIGWHTDGYYHPEGRTIRGMVLHAVRTAADGGCNRLLDHELAYLALRDVSMRHVMALMQPDVMTIPARADEDGVARAARSGPVFSVEPRSGVLHMRYTERTRSIVWKDDAATRSALACLQDLLDDGLPWIRRVRLEPGMGVVGHNPLHARSAFRDDPARPRLLYRVRFIDRCTAPGGRVRFPGRA